MAQHEIQTQWMGKMQFNALVNGHTVIMDAPERAGGEDRGPIPKPFVLTALSGCSGMDIIAVLRKGNIEINDLAITVTGESSKGTPVEYVGIHVIYDFTGNEFNRDAALDAVTLSQEKYCGVIHMLRKALPVTWEVVYNKMKLFSNKEGKEIIFETGTPNPMLS